MIGSLTLRQFHGEPCLSRLGSRPFSLFCLVYQGIKLARQTQATAFAVLLLALIATGNAASGVEPKAPLDGKTQSDQLASARAALEAHYNPLVENARTSVANAQSAAEKFRADSLSIAAKFINDTIQYRRLSIEPVPGNGKFSEKASASVTPNEFIGELFENGEETIVIGQHITTAKVGDLLPSQKGYVAVYVRMSQQAVGGGMSVQSRMSLLTTLHVKVFPRFPTALDDVRTRKTFVQLYWRYARNLPAYETAAQKAQAQQVAIENEARLALETWDSQNGAKLKALQDHKSPSVAQLAPPPARPNAAVAEPSGTLALADLRAKAERGDAEALEKLARQEVAERAAASQRHELKEKIAEPRKSLTLSPAPTIADPNARFRAAPTPEENLARVSGMKVTMENNYVPKLQPGEMAGVTTDYSKNARQTAERAAASPAKHISQTVNDPNAAFRASPSIPSEANTSATTQIPAIQPNAEAGNTELFKQRLTLVSVALGMALVAMLLSLRAGKRRRFVDDSPTSKTAGVFIGEVKLKGTAESERPLVSYLTESKCVYYKWSISEKWERTVIETYRDSEGRTRTRTRTETGWKTIDEGNKSIRFYLRDDCGIIRVAPEGAKFEPSTAMNRTCTPSDPLYYEKGPSTAVANSVHQRGFVEKVILLHAPLCVMGQARLREDVVAAEIAADKRATLFLISTRSEKQISRRFRIWFWLFGVFGFGLVWWLCDALTKDSSANVPYCVAAGLGYLLVWLLGWVWMAFNSLIKLQQRVHQGWSNVDVQLKRRSDLIPSLVNIVTGLRDHEQMVQTELAALRAQIQAAPPGKSGPALAGCVPLVNAIVEAYPEIKAYESFVHLQKQLVDTEQRIALARSYFNDIATFYNRRLQIVPDRFVATLGRLQPQALITATDFERASVHVEFAT